jgi:hypothetical protein
MLMMDGMSFRRLVPTFVRLTAAMCSSGLVLALACGESNTTTPPVSNDGSADDGSTSEASTTTDGSTSDPSAYCTAVEAARTTCQHTTNACQRESCKQLEANVASDISKSAFIECTANQTTCMNDGASIDGSAVTLPPQIQCQVDKVFAAPVTTAARTFAQHYCATCPDVDDKAACEKAFFEKTENNHGEILIGQDLKGKRDEVITKLDTECNKADTFDAGGEACYLAYTKCRARVIDSISPAPCGDE